MQNKKLFAVILSLALLCALGIYVLAIDKPETETLVSPGISILEKRTVMIKTGIRGYEIRFDEVDFCNALGTKNIDGIKITSLPEVSDGVLKLGAIDVLLEQTISSSALSALRFLPGESNEAAFEFMPVGSDAGHNIQCNLYILQEMNFAPDAEDVSLKTEKGIPVFASLCATDPEGDHIKFEICKYPEHGTLYIVDDESGQICYTPYGNYRGKDHFSYTVSDQYGNQSTPATVQIQIEKSGGISYCDMTNHWAYYAAVKMAKAGVISGETVGSSVYFYPDKNVTREEFVSMAMKALGYDDYIALSTGTPFADDDQIESTAKPYLSVAYRLGIINGTRTDSGLYFSPKEVITRAKAATVLARLMDIGKPVSSMHFDDQSTAPAWAQDSLAALCENGIIVGTGDGNIAPLSALSRAEAVQMLYRACEFKDAQ